MTVDEIAIPKADALKAFHAYRNAVREDRPVTRSVWAKEDQALARAYKAASNGHRLIALTQAFRRAGVKAYDVATFALPVLAICPSDAARCRLDMERDGRCAFSERQWAPNSRTVRILEGVLPKPTFLGTWWEQTRNFMTIVPMVPPQLRPKFSMANYHTLWEVEEWTLEPPTDPMLLRHLGGDLYVVLSTWDLSPLERAVLRQTRRV